MRKFENHEKRLRDLETQEIGVPAAGGGITLIDEIVPTSGGSLTFSSIPSTHRHLRLVWISHRDGTAIGETLLMQFNGDTGNKYMLTRHNAIAGSIDPIIHTLSDSNGFTSSISIGETATDHASWDAAHVGFGFIDIPYYKDTASYKNVLATHGSFKNAKNGMQHSLISATWEDASAITSILVKGAAAEEFKSPSRFSLYGIV